MDQGRENALVGKPHLLRAASAGWGERLRRRAPFAVAVGGSGVLLAWMVVQGQGQLAMAAALSALFVGVFYLNPRAGVALVFVFLAVLGDFRRMLIPLAGWPSQDPLLLVMPAVIGLVMTVLLATRRIRLETGLSRWVFGLLILMGVQMLNPAQAHLMLGVAGGLFYIVPVCWFWIGRVYATDAFVERLLVRVVLPLAAGAALLGLYQVFFGLLSYEQAWVEQGGYTALRVGGAIRPFSFFVSASEFAIYLGVALVIVLAYALRRSWKMLLPAPLLFWSLFLISGRGVILLLVFTGAFLWTVQKPFRTWAPRIAVALLIGLSGLFWSMNQVQEAEFSGSLQYLVQHQAGGLANPFSEEHSTLHIHLTMLEDGVRAAFQQPLGIGLGATTRAAGLYGQTVSNTELDLINVLISLGVLGGLVYGIVIALVLVKAVRYWSRARTLTALALLGLLVLTLGQWLNGAHYAVAALIWFCIGALDGLEKNS